jgi:hypothetical protein
MAVEDILNIVKENISTQNAETIFGIESWIVGEDDFYKDLKEKLVSNINKEIEEDLLP